jgi:hypothetical protein
MKKRRDLGNDAALLGQRRKPQQQLREDGRLDAHERSADTRNILREELANVVLLEIVGQVLRQNQISRL